MGKVHADCATVSEGAVRRLMLALDAEDPGSEVIDELFGESMAAILSLERLEQKLGGARWKRLLDRLSQDVRFVISTYKNCTQSVVRIEYIVENMIYAWEDGYYALVRSYQALLNHRRVSKGYVVALIQRHDPRLKTLIAACFKALTH